MLQAYAFDLVLLSPTLGGLRKLTCLIEELSSDAQLVVNVNETVVMIIRSSVDDHFGQSTMHFIGRVTMLFANNSLMECLITMKFLHIFLHPDVIFSSHTMLINASTKDFTPIHLVTFSI